MKRIYIVGITVGLVACSVLVMRESFSVFNDDISEGSQESKKLLSKTTEPSITSKEEEEYKKLAAKNLKAREIFNDVKVFVAIANQLAEFIPQRDVTVRGATFNLGEVKDLVRAMIGTVYNVAEMGLGVIEIVEEQAPALRVGVKCLQYTDAELKAAAAKGGKKVESSIEKCMQMGCTSKRGCVARVVKTSALAFNKIFDNAVVKYDVGTGLFERGFILNVDYIIDWLLKKVMTNASVRNYLSSKSMTVNNREVSYLQRTEAFMKKIDALREIVLFAGQAMSGVSGALVTAAALIDPGAITVEEMGQYEEAIREAQREKIELREDRLDELLLSDPDADII